MRRRRAVGLLTALAAFGAVPALAAFQDEEPANFAKTDERYEIQTADPAFQTLLVEKSLESKAEEAEIASSDPERNPFSSLCFQHSDGCAGDVRFYDWDSEPGNIRRGPILWTARSGATISGHVWAVKEGPAKRPGVVITNGSVQAPEQLYWAQAAVLARAGYVVLTWDPQTQGRSDGPGGPGTENENSQAQTPEAFTEGTVDAIDFFRSTPDKPFRPRNSRTVPSINHSAKQIRRVAEKRNAAFNPLHAMVDPERLGIAGNSLGAFAVSTVASKDPRVDAVVAWDQLSTAERTGTAGVGAPVAPRVPGLGMSGDYGIGSPNGAAGVTPKPRESAPDPQGANGPSRDFTKAGIPTMQVNTRAGTHFESAVIPNAGFPATLRGNDQTAWYTLAWFDRYVREGTGSNDSASARIVSSADRRLLTNRWQRDPRDLEIDPEGKGNLFSPTLRSRIDIATREGEKVVCEDLRTGCGVLVDDRSGPFSALEFGYGRQTLAPVRPASCATTVRAPRRLDLSRSGRRLRVRLRLGQRTRVSAHLKRMRPRVRGFRRTRTLGPGTRSVLVRVRPRGRPGRYRVKVGLRCVSGRQVRVLRLRVVR